MKPFSVAFANLPKILHASSKSSSDSILPSIKARGPVVFSNSRLIKLLDLLL